jgi:hypothetical protein
VTETVIRQELERRVQEYHRDPAAAAVVELDAADQQAPAHRLSRRLPTFV